MIFFIIMGTLCISLHVNAETKLGECKGSTKYDPQTDLIYSFGIVCVENGKWSRVLYWETDIFEIGFDQMVLRRNREINVRILLNIYYIEIKVISDIEERTVKVILSECLHKSESCSENRRFTHNDVDIHRHQTYVAIGFRKDKKMNFVAVTKRFARATNHFGPDNVYEFKKPGFYFKTDETMKISVESVRDKNFRYDGLAMHLPTSVGGMLFNEDGFFAHDDFGCDYYDNPNEKEGIAYIIKEYFNNSENWKAPPVKWTREPSVPYFGEKGMKVEKDEMKIKEAPNPNFDAKKQIRKGCKYVDAPKKPEGGVVPTDKPKKPEVGVVPTDKPKGPAGGSVSLPEGGGKNK